jgi:two-component system cell cycle response regulator
MTARVLVVDDIFANVKLLETRLTAEYFEVLTAMNGADALALCERGDIDIVLLDVMMPGMDGFEVCRRLKASPTTAHLPVIMVTALDQPSDRLKGLEAGADDFVTKPIREVALLTRVRSLVRIKMMTDELRARAQATSRTLGIRDPFIEAISEPGQNGRVMIVEDRAAALERMQGALSQHHTVETESDPQAALLRIAEGNFDCALISLGLKDFDGLRLCSQLRSMERTRHLPLVVISDADSDAKVLRGLDLGVNDYLMRPTDRNELLARVRTQVKNRRYAERLRDNLQASMELAITDPLTGLHNRRYMQSHLAALLGERQARGKGVTLCILDIDHFKAVNDTYGHDAGDEVLREFAQRLRKHVRGVDLLARFGGEEFVVAMPDTDSVVAFHAAERIRRAIENDGFAIHGGTRTINLTCSIGMAGLVSGEASIESLLKRADEALYQAKRAGRNKVVGNAA